MQHRAPGPSERELLDRAELVFVGVAVAREEPNPSATVMSSGDPIAWTFAVEEVVKGNPTNPQRVNTARGEATCGFPFKEGRRYVVFASSDGGTYTTALFSGTREVVPTTSTAPPPTTTTVPPPPTHPLTVPTTGASDPGRLPETGSSGGRLWLGALTLFGTGALLRRQLRRAR